MTCSMMTTIIIQYNVDEIYIFHIAFLERKIELDDI